MRLHRLEIEGFGPFRDRQIVDFDAYADDGIFLIAGRTGAGKSSILDAVCFGLYGGVPRYDSGEKRLRSDHCAPEDLSEVVVEFSTTAGRFRVARSPEYLRPAKRGGGLTKQAPRVALEKLTDAGWAGVAARAVDVAGELEGILQLNQQQFLQVILLAQNRFARFLLADSKERQALLRRLFGTERFEDVQSRFEERRRASENRLGARLATVSARLEEAESLAADEEAASIAETGGSAASERENDAAAREAAADAARSIDERLDALQRVLARVQYRSERRDAERDAAETASAAADAALAEHRELRAAQQERNRARAALAALDDAEPGIAAAVSELERAQAAETLRTVIAAVERAEGAVHDAHEHLDRARAEAETADVPAALTEAEALRAWAAELTRESGGWEQAALLERDRTARSAELEGARARAEERRREVDRSEAERAELPERVAELTLACEQIQRDADRADALRAEQERARARAAAAQESAGLSAQLEAVEQVLVDASAETAQAQAALADLRRRRFAGIAGELATELEPETACPVCGSLEHPAPATHTDPVSADDIDAAEAERDAAARAERAASERAAQLRAQLAGASARAEDRDVARAAQELASIEEALATASDAAERVAHLRDELSGLRERGVELESDRAAAASALAEAREMLAALEQRDADAEAQITAARGGFERVADRVAEAANRVRRAQRLADALDEHERATREAHRATTECRSELAASSFADAAGAESALRTSAEREALQQRIAAHAAQREKERAILLDLELRVLPEEPIDVEAFERAAALARTSWAAAVDAAGRAAAAVDRLGALIESATAEHRAMAEQTAQHELLKGLADTIAGRGANTHKMTLETFVLAAELEEIVAAANRRLSDMSTGRYRLEHSDALAARGAASGLGIVVYDAFTGQTRPAQSLSGGETFLSSLALALGLAEVVTSRAGGITLDTLFIDEGFGSLDADTLEVAMRTLDELRAGGRTVGIISHVEAMQEQIPAQLRVEQTDAGPSRIIG